MDTWIQLSNKYNSDINRWQFRLLKKGAYGYDNMCLSLYKVFIYINKYPGKIFDKEKIASLIHDGWCENYIYWRDNKPYNKSKIYIKPYNKLDDERRNMLAITKFEDIPQDEKDKNYIIADFLINEFKDKIHYKNINGKWKCYISAGNNHF
jgi:hypothetical protein